ncbi:zinc-dependent alcohol dehydrogenase family protein [Saccharomonospora iraqiensis]|uniref:zinc-dependent alcohol dehydrogenase family protein n=1 Tax=Saccharomonospora iraqiensis TaxID=52698 RepID=UPI00047ACFB4|nr:zinc-dependent alcohol dehydrogenase family protein [Saccharomonospora iraqiensis]
MSRIVRFHETGGPEVLRLDEVEVPRPGADEVLIEAHALGLNRAEEMFREGQYVQEPALPAKIGYEVAGTVREAGENVTHVRNGDAVSVIPAFTMTDYGMHGEVVLAPSHAVVKHPEHLSWDEAAAAWMMFVTAYGGLIDLAGVGEGDTVLIPAASSSVGLAAIQICTMVGATPVALSRTSSKRQALLDHGAAAVIATQEQDVSAEVHRLTGGAGARVAFDPVGGPAFAELTASLAEEGIILVYGALESENTPLPVMDVLGKHLTIRGYELFELTTDPVRRTQAAEFVFNGLKKGDLKPVISAAFALDDIVAAHEYMASNQQLGKIIVRV